MADVPEGSNNAFHVENPDKQMPFSDILLLNKKKKVVERITS